MAGSTWSCCHLSASSVSTIHPCTNKALNRPEGIMSDWQDVKVWLHVKNDTSPLPRPSLYQEIWWNGQQYQHVLALRALLTGVIMKGLTLRKFVSNVCVCMFYVCLATGFVDWLDREFIYIRRVLKCAFTYDLSLTVLRWLNYYYYYPPCISAIPGDPRGKTPMHRWQFCGQRLHPQRYCHWNTGCKYMTEGPVVNHSFILPTISHHWNTGCEYMTPQDDPMAAVEK